MSDFTEMFADVYNGSDDKIKKFLRQIAPYMFEEGPDIMATNTPNPNPPQQPAPQPGTAPTPNPNPATNPQPKG